MPLIKRLTDNFIPDCPWVDIAINPVNCKGVMGAGLALAFRDYCPEMYESYRATCIREELVMGKLHIFHNQYDDTTIINLPTKNHWLDISNLDDIELGCQTLVRYLDQHPLKTVLLPMLGAGLGRLNHDNVYALFEKYLDPLPNVIFVCMRPGAVLKPPKYLMVGGSRKYIDPIGVEKGIDRGLDKFGLSFSDFEAGVSGGAAGVDVIAAGSKITTNPQDHVFGRHNLKSIVCLADWEKYGKTAGFVRNKTLLEAGTHFILFVGSKSVGTKMMKDMVEKHNKRADKIYHDECALDHVKDFEFKMKPTEAHKKLFIIDVSKTSE